MPLERHATAHLRAENVSVVNPPSPNLDESVNSEVHTRVGGVGVKIAPTPIASDPTFYATHVVTGTDIGASPGRESPLFEALISSDRSLFDFGTFLKGGALDDVFGVAPDSKSTRTSGHAPGNGKWEVMKLSGGLINVTVRAVRRCGDRKSWRSVIIKYAPPFMAAIGEGAPCGTFRQVSALLRFYRESPRHLLLSNGCQCVNLPP